MARRFIGGPCGACGATAPGGGGGAAAAAPPARCGARQSEVGHETLQPVIDQVMFRR
jgi:hypothetical protein